MRGEAILRILRTLLSLQYTAVAALRPILRRKLERVEQGSSPWVHVARRRQTPADDHTIDFRLADFALPELRVFLRSHGNRTDQHTWWSPGWRTSRRMCGISHDSDGVVSLKLG